MAKKHLDPNIKLVWLLPNVFYLFIFWIILVAAEVADHAFTSNYVLFGGGIVFSSILLLACMIVFVLLPIYAYYHLLYEAYTYEITDTDIVIIEGIITRHKTVIPYSRITDVHSDADMIYRLFRMGKIYIKTPGPADIVADEGIIPGVPEKDQVARQIADRIALVKKEARKEGTGAEGGVGDHGSKTERQLLMEILDELRKQNTRE